MKKGTKGGLVWLLLIVLALGIAQFANRQPSVATQQAIPAAKSGNVTTASKTPLLQAPSSANSPAQTVAPVLMYVTASSLNVRADPSTAGKVLGKLPRGTRVEVVAVAGDWAQIALVGQIGWVSSNYLSTASPPTVAALPQQSAPVVKTPAVDQSKVVQAIIAQSIARYSGSCPCPYNTDRAGRRCGGRSAYSKPGGASPICFESDVTEAMIKKFLASH